MSLSEGDSLTPVELYFKDKTVAVVGNAESLFETEYGEEIDSHDVVIRMNRPAMFYPNKPNLESHGEKFNVWAFWDYTWFIENPLDMPQSMVQYMHYFPTENDGHFLDTKRNRPNGMEGKYWKWDGELQEKFTYDKFRSGNGIKNRLPRAHPSTGLLVLYILDEISTPKHIDVYGFDFKHTATFNERPHERAQLDKTTRWDNRCGHDYVTEEDIAIEEIFTLDKFTLKNMYWDRSSEEELEATVIAQRAREDRETKYNKDLKNDRARRALQAMKRKKAK